MTTQKPKKNREKYWEKLFLIEKEFLKFIMEIQRKKRNVQLKYAYYSVIINRTW